MGGPPLLGWGGIRPRAWLAAQFVHTLVEQSNRAALSVKAEKAETLPFLYALLNLLLCEAGLRFLCQPSDGDGRLSGPLQLVQEVEENVQRVAVCARVDRRRWLSGVQCCRGSGRGCLWPLC